jgi:hypothetical protein
LRRVLFLIETIEQAQHFITVNQKTIWVLLQ